MSAEAMEMILNKSPLLKASWECTKFLFLQQVQPGDLLPQLG